MGALRRRFSTQMITLVTCLGCGGGEPAQALPEPLARSVMQTYAELAHAVYGAARAELEPLREAVRALVATPSEQTLAEARAAWIAARGPYRESEVFRFYGGPIDDVELLVNTWPIDERYVDAVIDDVARHPQLSEALLVEVNAREGETSISTGYHVIEYLLWGADDSPSGPGQRPFTDFATPRRAQYLTLATDLLARHLGEVEAAWATGRDNYRARFLALRPRDALAQMVRGMGSLSGPELRGERLTVAYETRDQENEHSCFSDTTHADVLGNTRGVENVCLGRFRQVKGPGLCALLDAYRPALGRQLRTELAASVRAAESLIAPFDQAILAPDASPARAHIARTMEALDAQTRSLEAVARALGVGVEAHAAVRP